MPGRICVALLLVDLDASLGIVMAVECEPGLLVVEAVVS